MRQSAKCSAVHVGDTREVYIEHTFDGTQSISQHRKIVCDFGDRMRAKHAGERKFLACNIELRRKGGCVVECGQWRSPSSGRSTTKVNLSAVESCTRIAAS